MQKEWIISKPNKSAKKSLLERLLAVRGITDKKEIEEFLNPLEMKLSEPNAFCDMEKATERIVNAIENKQKILIYGDFDADGITSTSILLKTLKYFDADVDYYIPDRESEGHGMNTKTLVKILTAKKPKVLITVDCGISNFEEVKFLNSFNVDVIITDHHETPENLPPAFAIINPKAPNSLNEKLSARKIQELTSLAGCGVAFKLAQSLLLHYKKPELINELLPLVTVGTVADLVPLIGENRYFITKGLQLISQGQHYGLARLLENCGYNLESGITSENIAFGVAPRINATGRIDNVETALKLLLSDSKTEIEIIIQTLNELNKIRQNLCESTFLEADEMLQKENNNDKAIILFKKDWEVGIIGIVASKFVEKYYKPTFILTYSTENNQYKCSARSVKGINLYDVLTDNAELFDGFGGHEMAGGFSFSEDKVSLETVKNSLNKTISEIAENKEFKPIVNIDLELEEKDLDISIVDEISKLEPFGMANPSPKFVVNNFTLKEKTLMGENKNHLRLKVQNEDSQYTCIWWSKGDISLIAGDKLDIVFTPQINTFRDTTSLQLIVNDIHSESLKEENLTKNEVKIYDHRNKNNIFAQVNDYIKTSKLNILVFAENKDVIKNLEQYENISKNIINRNTVKSADSIMFFDYPPEENDFDFIVDKVAPRHIHYMNCEFLELNEQDILKTTAGMIKYSCNKNNGIFDLQNASVYLGITKDCLVSILELFSECKMIDILKQNENNFEIEFINNIEISQVLHSLKYSLFKEKLNDIIECKTFFMQKEI